MPAESAIRVENLTKKYHIWSSPLARLSGPAYARLSRQPLLPKSWRERAGAKARSAHREFHALEDISFEVPWGQSVGIIGRNGAGKSTLLQIITGTLSPTAGSSVVNGRTAALLELGSGFNPEFTGRENVRLNASLYGLTPAEIERRMDAILAFADIGDFVDEPVKTYSSGMMLRLAFAVIAHIDADILIIDEALAVGDVFFVQKCMTFLRQFQEKGVLLLVTHSPESILSLCQHALWLDHGRLRMAGSPKDVTEAYLEAFFQADAEAKLGARAKKETAAKPEQPVESKYKVLRDQRLQFLNHTQYRNDLQIFEFDQKASSFGVGGARILSAVLEDEAGHPLSWIVGGEIVTLKIYFETLEPLRNPILGFYVKNRLGQQLFGDNTYLACEDRDLSAPGHARFAAAFTFQMPLLPVGDYSILLGVADGTMEDHVIHHWIHDGLIFKSVASSVRSGGLVGLPMLSIDIEPCGETAAEMAPATAAIP